MLGVSAASLILLLVASSLRTAFATPWAIFGLDYRNFLTAAMMVVGGARHELYSFEAQFAWQQKLLPELTDPTALLVFPYPPFVALVLAPLALVPPATGYVLLTGVNAVLLGTITFLLLRWVVPPEHASPVERLLVVVLSLTWLPVVITMLQGQVALVLVLSFLMSWQAFAAGRERVAGMWLGLLCIKPYFLVVPALVLAWKRRREALMGMGLVGVLCLAVSAGVVGVEGLGAYVQAMASLQAAGEIYGIHPSAMQSWRGLLNLVLNQGSAQAVLLVWAAGSLVALAGFAWSWGDSWAPRGERFDLQWALLILVTVFISPHLYVHDLSLLVLAGALVVRSALGRRATSEPGRMNVQRLGADQATGALLALPVVGYGAVWVSPFLVQVTNLHISVVFLILAMGVLGWVLKRTG